MSFFTRNPLSVRVNRRFLPLEYAKYFITNIEQGQSENYFIIYNAQC